MTETIKEHGQEAWGVLYLSNNKEHFIFLKNDTETLWRSQIDKLCSVRKRNLAALLVRSLTDQKLFTIEKFVKDSRDQMRIMIIARIKEGLTFDGLSLRGKAAIENGRCEIGLSVRHDMPELDLVFEAFCDVSHSQELMDIGGNYRYVNKLGRGGFSEVYKGFSIDKGQFCAIKVEKNKINKKSRLHEEFNFMKELDHSNIIKSLDFVSKNGHKYLVTQLAEGGNLGALIKLGENLDETATKTIFKQIFFAVEYLHKKNIIHRDIKPENIVLMSPGSFTKAKLIDFGLSCSSLNSHELHRVAGTTRYMAPEMLNISVTGNHSLRYSDKIDVWALGVTLFYTLTRYTPFAYRGDTEDYRKRVLENKVQTSSQNYERLSTSVKMLLQKCLQIDEAKRPLIEQLVDDDWFQYEHHPSILVY